jgi:hypothetical protein
MWKSLLTGNDANKAAVAVPCWQRYRQRDMWKSLLTGNDANKAAVAVPCRQRYHQRDMWKSLLTGNDANKAAVAVPCRQRYRQRDMWKSLLTGNDANKAAVAVPGTIPLLELLICGSYGPLIRSSTSGGIAPAAATAALLTILPVGSYFRIWPPRFHLSPMP